MPPVSLDEAQEMQQDVRDLIDEYGFTVPLVRKAWRDRQGTLVAAKSWTAKAVTDPMHLMRNTPSLDLETLLAISNANAQLMVFDCDAGLMETDTATFDGTTWNVTRVMPLRFGEYILGYMAILMRDKAV